MPSPVPVPPDEAERLAALHSYAIAGTAPEPDYDHIARLAAGIFRVPIALISFVESRRQWLKAHHGLSVCETSREVSFCGHAILQDEIMVVPDAALDPRFADNPLVTGEPRIRFYAGAPLVMPTGHRIGTLCIIDHVPREGLTSAEQATLRDLVRLVVNRLEQRRLEGVKRAATRMASATSDAILVADGSGTIRFWNRAAEAMFGYTRAEAVGQPLSIIIPRRFQALHEGGLMRVRHGGAPRLVGRPVEVTARRKDGREFPIELSLSLWDEDGALHAGAIVRDISERRKVEERLRSLAHYDQLTELPNWAMFNDRLAAAAEAGPTTCLMLNVDRFREVNDLGHGVGDEVLRQLAQRLRTGLPDEALAARLSGDEFAILVPGNGDAVLARETADRLLDLFEEPYQVEGRALRLRGSVGVSLQPDLASGAEELRLNAALALREAKEAGGGRATFFHPGLRQQLAARRSLEDELHGAFARGEFELYYQPQVGLEDGRVIGAEALLRWRHPERGLLAPAAFLPVLEASPLAAAVGDWTLQAACAFGAALGRAGLPRIRIGVNTFAAQFRSGDLAAKVAQALDESGLRPEDLEIEITENIVLRHQDGVIDGLHALKRRGVGIAFDDYGTGFASLSLLKRFPLTRLKIDRSFVRDLATDPEDAAIVRAVLALGGSLGLEVIAEGVEAEEQVRPLAAWGCTQAQGYLYGRPMPGQELAMLLAGADSRGGRAGAAMRA